MQEQPHEQLIQQHGPDRSPCPVCGHPTSDCKPTTTIDLESRPVFKETASLVNDKVIYVDRDVIEEREIAPHTRVSFVIAKKGTYITPARAKELGII